MTKVHVRKRVKLDGFEPSLTHQEFAGESDINNIVKKYKRTGVVSHVSSVTPLEGDFSEAVDFHTAMNIVADAQQRFDALPATVRKRFSNDPALFLDAFANPEMLPELKSLGLILSDSALVENQPTSLNPEPTAKGDPSST